MLQNSLTLLWNFIPRSIIHLIICYLISIHTLTTLTFEIKNHILLFHCQLMRKTDPVIQNPSSPRKRHHFSLLTYLHLLKHNSYYQEIQSCTVFPATNLIYFWSPTAFTHPSHNLHLLKKGMSCCYRKVPMLNGLWLIKHIDLTQSQIIPRGLLTFQTVLSAALHSSSHPTTKFGTTTTFANMSFKCNSW